MTSIEVYRLTRAVTLRRTESTTLSGRHSGRAIGQSTYHCCLLLAGGTLDCLVPAFAGRYGLAEMGGGRRKAVLNRQWRNSSLEWCLSLP
jgi:hypothetical protein